MARTRGAASRDAGSLYARSRAIAVLAARRLGDRDDARCAAFVSALLCAFECFFCALIITTVPFTEIDWRAYMDEVGGFLQGERDYTKLKGDTGPLVYPAGFVYLYAFLKKVIIGCADDSVCADAENVRVAQYVFLVVYGVHLAVTLKTYYNARGVVPPYALVLLALSKRVHSIFVLRMFNDGVASVFAHAAVFFAQKRKWPLCFFMLSLGVSVKMNVLLMIPPALVLLVGSTKPSVAIGSVVIFVATQLLLSAPFFISGFITEYVSCAFEFSRAFEYTWTVNWRFVSRDTFGSSAFTRTLLVLHVVGLFLFAHKKWYRVNEEVKTRAESGEKTPKKLFREGRFFFKFFADWFRRLPRDASPSKTITESLTDPAHVMSTLHEGVFIGVLFARSLHYQFYAWYFHSLPFLLWRCDFFEAFAARAFRSETAAVAASDAARVLLLLTIERSWNVFPATEESSRTLFAAHAVLLVGLFFSRKKSAKKKKSA